MLLVAPQEVYVNNLPIIVEGRIVDGGVSLPTKYGMQGVTVFKKTEHEFSF